MRDFLHIFRTIFYRVIIKKLKFYNALINETQIISYFSKTIIYIYIYIYIIILYIYIFFFFFFFESRIIIYNTTICLNLN
jgi:hypothetical protein